MPDLRKHGPRFAAGSAILAVAVTTGIVSYSHIYRLTIALHQLPVVARLMPFGVDGLIVVGSVVLLTSGRLGWLCVGPGIAISLFANVESGIGFGWLAALWAGVPAVTFALSTFTFERWLSKSPVPHPVLPCPGTVAGSVEAPAPGRARKSRAADARAVATPGPVHSPGSLPVPAADPVQSPVPVPSPGSMAGPPAVSSAGGGQGQANRAAVLRLKSLNPDMTREQIAAELGVSVKTVSRHSKRLTSVNGSGSHDA